MKQTLSLLLILVWIATPAFAQTPKDNSSGSNGGSSNIVTPERFALDHQTGGVPAGEEGDLGFLVNRQLGDIAELQKECVKRKCSLIVLIDAPLGRHADLGTPPEGGGSPLRENNKQNIIISECRGKSCDADHGTLMAGIIASQKNGFGIIGINPIARIQSLDWNYYKDKPDNFSSKLAEIWNAEHSKGLPIFVMATHWSLGSRVPTLEARDRDRMVQVIKNSRYLFIVAAGQAEDMRSSGSEITTLYPDGPMNLGDQENVLVVSAYADDQLLNFANYSMTRLVHVAAAGERILTTSAGSEGGAVKYNFVSGTSPATAIVAGIASTMISKWPNYFRYPVDVKTRLQVISSPTLKDVEFNRIAAGVLNSVTLALRDPDKDLLKPPGDNPEYLELGEFKGWKAERIKVLDPETYKVDEDLSIPTKDVYRICKIGERWVIYSRLSKDECASGNPGSKCDGQIKKRGPYFLDIFDPAELFVADDQNGRERAFNFGEFTDLVLRETRPFLVPSIKQD